MKANVKELKQKVQVSEHANLMPKAVKKVIQSKQNKLTKQISFSGGLSRLLDANGDCI